MDDVGRTLKFGQDRWCRIFIYGKSEILYQFLCRFIIPKMEQFCGEVNYVARFLTSETVKAFVHFHGRMPVIMKRTAGHAVAFYCQAIVFCRLTGCDLGFYGMEQIICSVSPHFAVDFSVDFGNRCPQNRRLILLAILLSHGGISLFCRGYLSLFYRSDSCDVFCCRSCIFVTYDFISEFIDPFGCFQFVTHSVHFAVQIIFLCGQAVDFLLPFLRLDLFT